MSRRVAATMAAAVALILAPSRPAWAGEDYGVDTDSWNGVGYLVETGAEAKVEVQIADALDLEELGRDEVLLWLYPLDPMPVDDLLAFVGDGGSLVVADDHGSAEPLLAAAGITRSPRGPTTHGEWFEGEDGFPIVRARGEHFIFFNVEEVVANHPAVLGGEGTPLMSFDGDGEHLAVERRLGQGRLLALGDPSMFLNQMLRRFYGNKQLAANLMRVYCAREPCKVRLLLPHTTTSGRYTPGGGPGPLPRLAQRAAETINEALAGLSSTLSEPPWSIALALLLALALCGLAALALALWRRQVRGPALDGGILGRTPVVAEALGLSAVRADADFYALARTLAEHAERLAGKADLPAIAEGRRPPPRGVDSGDVMALTQALLRLRDDAASLRSRQPPVISAERFARIHGDVQTLTRFAK